jgi:hypothetical protein
MKAPVEPPSSRGHWQGYNPEYSEKNPMLHVIKLIMSLEIICATRSLTQHAAQNRK